MIATFAPWWRNLAARERLWLSVGAALTGLLLFWALIWDPLAAARTALRAEALDNERALRWMRPAAESLIETGGLAAVAVADGRSLLARVDAGAREAGLAGGLTGVEPLGAERVRVRFEAVPFDALIAWLETESNRSLAVEEMALRRAGAVGLVEGQAVLRREGR